MPYFSINEIWNKCDLPLLLQFSLLLSCQIISGFYTDCYITTVVCGSAYTMVNVASENKTTKQPLNFTDESKILIPYVFWYQNMATTCVHSVWEVQVAMFHGEDWRKEINQKFRFPWTK